jgi:hypothetical protein
MSHSPSRDATMQSHRRAGLAFALIGALGACSGSGTGTTDTLDGSIAGGVRGRSAVAVKVSPATAAVDGCQTLHLDATVTGSSKKGVTWRVEEGSAGGSITSAGDYTAPEVPGTYHAVATSIADPAKAGVATIAVSHRVLGVAVTPASSAVGPGAASQFVATVTTTCGSFTSSAAAPPTVTQ